MPTDIEKARAVLEVLREFKIDDEVIVTEKCLIASWVGLRGRIASEYMSGDRLAFGVKLHGPYGAGQLGFRPEELCHAD